MLLDPTLGVARLPQLFVSVVHPTIPEQAVVPILLGAGRSDKVDADYRLDVALLCCTKKVAATRGLEPR